MSRHRGNHHRPDPPPISNRHQSSLKKEEDLKPVREPKERTALARVLRSLTTLEQATPFRDWLKGSGLHFKEMNHSHGSRYFYIRHLFDPKREAVVRFSDHPPGNENTPLIASVDGKNHTIEEARKAVIDWLRK